MSNVKVSTITNAYKTHLRVMVDSKAKGFLANGVDPVTVVTDQILEQYMGQAVEMTDNSLIILGSTTIEQILQSSGDRLAAQANELVSPETRTKINDLLAQLKTEMMAVQGLLVEQLFSGTLDPSLREDIALAKACDDHGVRMPDVPGEFFLTVGRRSGGGSGSSRNERDWTADEYTSTKKQAAGWRLCVLERAASGEPVAVAYVDPDGNAMEATQSSGKSKAWSVGFDAFAARIGIRGRKYNTNVPAFWGVPEATDEATDEVTDEVTDE
jgi:hypothetical protein